MVTLKDIALEANMSISTVSRIIRGDKKRPASKKTTERVLRIAQEMGYVPNENAINLKCNINSNLKRIGCIYASSRDVMKEPFFSKLTVGINEELDRLGYTMGFSLCIYEMSFDEIRRIVIKERVDGIILMGRVNKVTLDFFKRNYHNLVYAGVNDLGEDIDEVICDAKAGVKSMTNYIIELGHKRIGYIGDGIECNRDVMVNEHRYNSFMEEMEKHGLEVDKNQIIGVKPYLEEAYEMIVEHLETRGLDELATAYICINDNTAIAAIRAINDKGYKVPEDISVVGFDDIEVSKFLNPSLTTVRVDQLALGQMAVKMLIEKITTKREYSVKLNLPSELVLRESCKTI